jgi:hypothetical protein
MAEQGQIVTNTGERLGMVGSNFREF